jgi:hypothetical protein
MPRLLVVTLGVLWASLTYAQNEFSCSWGKRGACLDYNDKVCSSRAKCVDQNAVCLDWYTCNYMGFVFKSKLDDLADECQRVAEEHDSLVSTHNTLVLKHRNLQSCVSGARTLRDAQLCL